MMKYLPGLLMFSFFSCQSPNSPEALTTLSSPNERLELGFGLDDEGRLRYWLSLDDRIIIDTSTIAQFDFRGEPALGKGLSLIGSETKSFSETWEPLWGEDAQVENTYNELLLSLQEVAEPKRSLKVCFRLYNDGLGFRYEFPKWEGTDSLVVMDETTTFHLTGDHRTWWIPGDWDIYEHVYNETPFSGIDATKLRDHAALAQTYIPENAVNTPVTQRTSEGIHLSFHEANLTNYSGMTLKVDKNRQAWVSELVGGPEGVKAFIPLPFNTPWRTIQLGDEAGDLIESKLIVNLNEPNKLGRLDWIKPLKYIGIWWEMHIDRSTWDMASGRHGATTENAKRYMDFAAANNIDAVLVEGWNTGWEGWIGFEDREGVFDFITPYLDYDLQEVVRYGEEKGVALIMHNETSAAPRTYEQQLDTAYRLYEQLGIHAIKTGYVGKIIPKGYYHHGQWMVRHYRKVLEKAAEHKIMIDAHEPIKATGLRRTYPNTVSREGLRGQEFNAWAKPNNGPDHTVIVPFTRMLGGPIDYTPGIFDIQIKGNPDRGPIPHTLARELALYVLLYSPLQMAADLPENYQGQPAFQFIRDVALDWEKSIVLNGEVGDYLTIARKEKNGERWFLGAGTDENPRELEVKLDFLEEGKMYRATLYLDGPDADYQNNPTSIKIKTQNVSAGEALNLPLASGGGAAIVIEPN